MAIISANLQFNRAGHELLDYSSTQKKYTEAIEWAKNPNSNAAVGQYIYLREDDVVDGVEYTKGPYVIDAIGENAVITPLSKSIAGSPDLVGEVAKLKSDVSILTTNINSIDATLNELDNNLDNVKKTAEAAVTITTFEEYKLLNNSAIDINTTTIGSISTDLNSHTNNTTVHIQDSERKRWTSAAEAIEAFKDVENIGDEVIDTLKEIQDYITSDLSAADKMTKDIAATQEVANGTKTLVDELTNTVNENYNEVLKTVSDAEINTKTYINELFEEVSGEVEKKLDTSVFNEFSEVINNVLNTKVDVTKYNTKIEEITSSINSISDNIVNVYTKSEVDTELALKVNVGDIYTKSEIDSLSNVYAPKAEFEEVQKKVEDITSTGGEPNVQSDWNTTDEKLDSYIKNKPDLSIFVKVDELNNKGYLVEENLQGYATENWVNEQNYLTVHQDISHLATKIDLNSYVTNESFDNLSNIVSKKADVSALDNKQDKIDDLNIIRQGAEKGVTALQEVPDGYAREEWVNANYQPKGEYLTTIPDEYITEEVLISKGYLTEHQDISHLATKDELSEIENKIPSIEGYATEDFVISQGYAKITDIPVLPSFDDYAKKSDIPSLDGYVTEKWVNERGYITEIPTEYITEEVLNSKGYLTEHQDISQLVTKNDLSDVEKKIPSIEGYAKEEWVSNNYQPKGDYLTEVPDEYVTITKLESKKYLTKVPESYATQSWVTEQIAKIEAGDTDLIIPVTDVTIDNVSVVVDGVANIGLSGYVTIEEYNKLLNRVAVLEEMLKNIITTDNINEYAVTSIKTNETNDLNINGDTGEVFIEINSITNKPYCD